MLVLRSMVLSERTFITFNLKVSPYRNQNELGHKLESHISPQVHTLLAMIAGAGNTLLIKDALMGRKMRWTERVISSERTYERRNPSGEMNSLIAYNVAWGPTVAGHSET